MDNPRKNILKYIKKKNPSRRNYLYGGKSRIFHSNYGSKIIKKITRDIPAAKTLMERQDSREYIERDDKRIEKFLPKLFGYSKGVIKNKNYEPRKNRKSPYAPRFFYIHARITRTFPASPFSR